MVEIVSGIWIGPVGLLNDTVWCKEKKINSIMNFAKHFETLEPVQLNYQNNNAITINDFIKKCVEKLYITHYKEGKNCLILCQNGQRISILIIIYYFAYICHISKPRALEIIKTKIQNLSPEPYILWFISR